METMGRSNIIKIKLTVQLNHQLYSLIQFRTKSHHWKVFKKNQLRKYQIKF